MNAPNRTPKKVLYVEDEDSDVWIMQRAFREEGLEEWLYVARDGLEAISWLVGAGEYADRAKYPLPDLVLLDMFLPKANGDEVLRWIRDQAALVTVPVIMFSSSDRETDLAEAYRLGANLYLSKPTGGDLRAVARFLVAWLQLSPSPRAYKTEWRLGAAEFPEGTAAEPGLSSATVGLRTTA
jgi:CheY-like chemotaxis protein